jgi:ADP-heptose:LPS heptosyltransferase
LGDARLNEPESWDLGLTAAEKAVALSVLSSWDGRHRFIAASLGTKCSAKDWGEEKWTDLLARVSAHYPDLGLLLVGAPDEEALSIRAANRWRGPVLNSCGRLSPRISAALMQHATAFVGHDSGPMHLAAAVEIPCVAVFSARNRPGEWFPAGDRHRVIYHKTECFGCRLNVCVEQKKKCIDSITVDEVLSALKQVMQTGTATI